MVSALIGSGLTLAGVIVTIKWKAKQKKQDEIDKVKPIVINYNYSSAKDFKETPEYFFIANDDTGPTEKNFRCVFKNTDNGILFLDYITSERKKYLPTEGSTVDKNTVFCVVIKNISGESLTGFKLYCHDILGNSYYYDAKYCSDANRKSELIIGPIKRVK